jgi:hypothetical protein
MLTYTSFLHYLPVYTDTAVPEQIETRMPGDTLPGNSDLHRSSNDVPEDSPSDSDMRQSTDDLAEQTPGDHDLPCLSDGSPEATNDILVADGNKVEREQGHSDNEMEIIENGATDMSIKDEYEITEVVWILEEKTTDGSELKDNGDLYTASLDVDLADQEPSEHETKLLTVMDEEIPVEPELADTDKTPAQPEHTCTGLVTETDEEIPSGPEKADTSDERKPDDSSPVGSVAEQDDTPVAPERNSRLFTETTNTLVTGNDNKVIVWCKHNVIVNVQF